MVQTQEAQQQAGAVYSLHGTLIEACSCNVLCPCWIGEDPDGGECYAIVAWHIDVGQVTGIDVSGRSVVAVAHIPGNILAGNWEVVVLVDDHSSAEQRDALVKVFSGQLGGPLADFAQLIGTVKGVESVPISHQVEGGIGTLSIPGSSRPRWSPTAARRAASPPCGTRSSPPCPARRPGCPRPAATG
jgi:hypothetical protein